MIPTHAMLVNGRTWMDVQGIDRGEHDDITRTLARLDGKKLYSLLLWRLPSGKSLDETSPRKDADEYIQCAGSDDRITVEVRRRRGDRFEHFVVGRAEKHGDGGKKVTIHWDSAETVVAPNEVLTPSEAAELFLAYYRTGWVPSRYVLRALAI